MSDTALLRSAIEGALSLVDDTAAVLGICAACADVLPGDGAAVTVMSSDAQRQTIYASDEVVAAVERTQYSMGDGPSLRAFTQERPVLVDSLADPAEAARWPVLVGELSRLDVGSLFCFPLRFGTISVGVLTLYRRSPAGLASADLTFVFQCLELTTLGLLELRGEHTDEFLLGRWLAVDTLNRRQVHQATGMMMGRYGVSAEEAFARLRARAYADERDIELVALDIVERRLSLERDEQ